jgi:hypothetical protein
VRARAQQVDEHRSTIPTVTITYVGPTCSGTPVGLVGVYTSYNLLAVIVVVAEFQWKDLIVG